MCDGGHRMTGYTRVGLGEGAHPRYGAIWIFCAPHEHPAPSAPPGRKDTASSSTIVCMGTNRCNAGAGERGPIKESAVLASL